MKKLVLIMAIFILGAGCTNTQKRPTLRDIAISLIENNYPESGRRLEYSQVDSIDSELQGYSILRVYIDSDDSIRVETFHLNYDKTKVKTDKEHSFIIKPDLYKLLLVKDKVFTDDLKSDIERITKAHAKFYGYDLELQDHYSDSIRCMIRQADSIACVEAASPDF